MRLCGRALKWSVCALPVNESSVVGVVRALVFLSSASLSARNIPVADSYRNAFGLLFLRSFVRTFVGSRVVSFVSSFLRSFVLSLFLSCLYWFVFLCTVVVSVHLRCAMFVGVICL